MVRQSPQRRSRALTQCSLATTTDPDAGRGSILSGWTIDARGRALFGRFEGKPSVNLELRRRSVREARRRWRCQKVNMHRQVAYFPKVDADMTGSNRHLIVQACDVRPGIHNVDQREAGPVLTFDPGLKLDRTPRCRRRRREDISNLHGQATTPWPYLARARRRVGGSRSQRRPISDPCPHFAHTCTRSPEVIVISMRSKSAEFRGFSAPLLPWRGGRADF